MKKTIFDIVFDLILPLVIFGCFIYSLYGLVTFDIQLTEKSLHALTARIAHTILIGFLYLNIVKKNN